MKTKLPLLTTTEANAYCPDAVFIGNDWWKDGATGKVFRLTWVKGDMFRLRVLAQ